MRPVILLITLTLSPRSRMRSIAAFRLGETFDIRARTSMYGEVRLRGPTVVF